MTKVALSARKTNQRYGSRTLHLAVFGSGAIGGLEDRHTVHDRRFPPGDYEVLLDRPVTTPVQSRVAAGGVHAEPVRPAATGRDQAPFGEIVECRDPEVAEFRMGSEFGDLLPRVQLRLGTRVV